MDVENVKNPKGLNNTSPFQLWTSNSEKTNYNAVIDRNDMFYSVTYDPPVEETMENFTVQWDETNDNFNKVS